MAISHDATATGEAGGSTVTVSHALGVASGNDRVVVAMGSHEGSTETVSTFTYNGTAGTLVGETINGNANIHFYRWIDSELPSATGSYDVVFTITGNENVGLIVNSYQGVDQTTPTEGYTEATSNQIPDITVTSETDDLVYDGYAIQENEAPGVGAGQTLRGQIASATEPSEGCSEEAGAASVTMSWNSNEARPSSHGGFNMNQAAAAPATVVQDPIKGPGIIPFDR